jgi:hypothetical protein
MGTTREELRIPKLRNRSSVLISTYCLLSAIVGYNLSGPLVETKVKNATLKLCQERPLECKFKYDIIRYQETGKVPYTEPIKEVKK